MTGRPPAGGNTIALVAVAGAVVAFTVAAGSLGSLLDAELSVESAPANETIDRTGGGIPNGTSGGGNATGGEGSREILPSSTVVDRSREWLPVAGLVLIAGALVFLRSVSAGDRVDPPTGRAERGGDGLDVTAGRARDQPPSLDAPVTNDVYRTWVQFRDLVGQPDDRTTTPTELGARASETADEASVEALLDTFQRVRYRGEDPTGDHERRARRAFERIERAYDHTRDDDRADEEPADDRVAADTDESTGGE